MARITQPYPPSGGESIVMKMVMPIKVCCCLEEILQCAETRIINVQPGRTTVMSTLSNQAKIWFVAPYDQNL